MADYKNENASTILYVSYLGEEAGQKYFLAVSTNVDPVDSTVEILKDQLIIVSIISLILAFILSLYLSSRLAAPCRTWRKRREPWARAITMYNLRSRTTRRSTIWPAP